VVPAGTGGPITLTFASNDLYRAELAGGLALLPVLMLLALIAPRRRPPTHEPTRPWRPGPVAGVGVLAAGAVIAGVAGVAVFGVALGARHLLRARPRLSDALAVGVTAGGLILAGVVLSRHPWRSVGGYVGHSWGVQLLALMAVAALAASAVSVTAPSSGGIDGRRRNSHRRNATRHGDSTSA
jgi:arabinofuranan 3-O-arabinosyltransferase